MRTIEFSAGMSRKAKQGIGSPERGLSKNFQRFNYQGNLFFCSLIRTSDLRSEVLTLVISGDRNTDHIISW